MINVGTMFSRSWERFSAHMGRCIGVFLAGSLILWVLGLISLGIVGVPLLAGLYKALRRAADGEAPDFGDLFSEFSNFGKWFVLWVVTVIIVALVSLVCYLLTLAVNAPNDGGDHPLRDTVISTIVPVFVGLISLALGMVMFFVIPLMLAKNLGALSAIMESLRITTTRFRTLCLPILLAIVISGAGSILGGIGAALVAPWIMIGLSPVMGPDEFEQMLLGMGLSTWGALSSPGALAISQSGSFAMGVGALFTGPWMMIASWVLYDSAYGVSTA